MLLVYGGLRGGRYELHTPLARPASMPVPGLSGVTLELAALFAA
jgi:hypothetical protein